MELPLYHRPNARTIGLLVWQRTIGFVKHAGTLILIMSLIIWALANIPTGNIETSILGSIGKALEPIGARLGLSWQLVVALLASFIAKENSIATLGILYGTGDDTANLAATLGTVIVPAAALSFLVVQMLFIPCAATVGAIRAGNALVEVDVVHDRAVGGGVVWRGVGGVSNRQPDLDKGGDMFDKLMAMLKRGGTVTIDQMARELDTSPEVVSGMIDHMTRAGLAAPDVGQL